MKNQNSNIAYQFGQNFDAEFSGPQPSVAEETKLSSNENSPEKQPLGKKSENPGPALEPDFGCPFIARLPGESERDYAIFLKYLNMGLNRKKSDLKAEFDLSEISLRRISREHQWEDRIAGWIRHEFVAEQRMIQKAKEEALKQWFELQQAKERRDFEISSKLYALFNRMLDQLLAAPLKNVRPLEIARVLVIASKVSFMATRFALPNSKILDGPPLDFLGKAISALFKKHCIPKSANPSK